MVKLGFKSMMKNSALQSLGSTKIIEIGQKCPKFKELVIQEWLLRSRRMRFEVRIAIIY